MRGLGGPTPVPLKIMHNFLTHSKLSCLLLSGRDSFQDSLRITKSIDAQVHYIKWHRSMYTVSLLYAWTPTRGLKNCTGIYWKTKICISAPMWFKPMWLKGQLYSLKKCTWIFIAAVFIMVRNEENPSVHQLLYLTKICYIHIIEYYSTIKKNKVLILDWPTIFRVFFSCIMAPVASA